MPDTTTCIFEGCEKPPRSRGWCYGHYKRWLRTGDPAPKPKPKSTRKCDFPGCEKPHAAHGWCAAHYRQELLGLEMKPLSPRYLPLEDRFWAKVVKGEGCWGWNGCIALGYARMGGEGVEHMAHRQSWKIHNGPIPEGMQVDHICHNTLCTRPDHLRLVTQKQNNEHLKATRKNSTTGVRGVSFSKKRNKWVGHVTHNYRYFHVGMFDSLEEAEAAVIAKRKELFTHNNIDRAA